MTDSVILQRVLAGFHAHADRLIREAAGHCDERSLEAAWGSALYVLQFAARGDFYGRVQVSYQGEHVKTLRVVEQDLPLPGPFADVYGVPDPADDNITRPARPL